jgi:hypothetical protein
MISAVGLTSAAPYCTSPITNVTSMKLARRIGLPETLTGDAVITCLDGHQMAKQGRAGPMLAIATIGSFFAGCVATVPVSCRRAVQEAGIPHQEQLPGKEAAKLGR